MVEQLDGLIDSQWLGRTERAIKPLRPVEDFRHSEFPVPTRVQAAVEAEMNGLERAQRELVNVMSVVDRPAGPTLLARCVGLPERVPDLLTQLEFRGVVCMDDMEGELWSLANPAAGRVLRSALSDVQKPALHQRIADAMAVRRRRSNAREVADHRRAAGDAAGAYPLYLRAAKAAARSGHTSQVLEITAQAGLIRTAALESLDDAVGARAWRWLAQLRGEALMARGRWDQAEEELGTAVEVARREQDDEAIARALGALGRCLYRSSQFSKAEPLLAEALNLSGPTSSARASTTRALADIRLRAGRLDESTALWTDALDLAMDHGSVDGEARARRGLAHLRCIQGRLQETAELLNRAEELLDPDGDDRVRAGVLARSVEIETCAGRYSPALRRCQSLVELARRREMSDRLPECYALLAEVLLALGDHAEAHDAAHQVLIFAAAFGRRNWAERLRAARVLAGLDRWDEVESALPTPEDMPTRLIDDPAAQLAAIRGRLYSRTDPARGADQATWALTRPPPLLAIRFARISIDAAYALAKAGQIEPARTGIKRGLKALNGPGADGLRLDLLLAMYRARPEARVADAIRTIALRIAQRLSTKQAARFAQRAGIEEALGLG
jgi:tetratricopeptide (TPR) repeat protein